MFYTIRIILDKIVKHNPWIQIDGHPFCYYCNVEKDIEDHDKDCLFIIAKTTLEKMT